MNVIASSPELRDAFSKPGSIELVLFISNLIEERNRFEEAYKEILQELNELKEEQCNQSID